MSLRNILKIQKWTAINSYSAFQKYLKEYRAHILINDDISALLIYSVPSWLGFRLNSIDDP